jgi:hypothetical protein
MKIDRAVDVLSSVSRIVVYAQCLGHGSSNSLPRADVSDLTVRQRGNSSFQFGPLRFGRDGVLKTTRQTPSLKQKHVWRIMPKPGVAGDVQKYRSDGLID